MNHSIEKLTNDILINRLSSDSLDYLQKLNENTVVTKAERHKVLMTFAVSDYNNRLEETKFFHFFFDVLQKCKGLKQNTHHTDDVFAHSIGVFNALPVDKPLLRLAGLLHDVGKLETRGGVSPNYTFYCHDVVGTRIVYKFLKTAGMKHEEILYITTLIRHHMFYFDDSTKNETILKWVEKTGGLWRDIIVLRLADRIGNHRNDNKPIITNEFQQIITRITNLVKS